MNIEDYRFGSMTVGGRTYGRDLLIFPDRVLPDWWRREGHLLDPADLGEVLAFGPAILVVGTGAYGRMEVPVSTREHLRRRGMELLAAPTKAACALYNDRSGSGQKVAGAFHLTC